METREEKAKARIEKMKEDIARDRAEKKKALAKSNRDAKKAPKINKTTFGDIVLLNSAFNKHQYYGFIYQIEIGNQIYIGKKSFESKPKWQTYRSSSDQVKRLIKRAMEMGVAVSYMAVELCHDSLSLQKAEINHIHSKWQQLASEGKLSYSLNIDNGSGLLKRDDWHKHYYLWSN